ncbi:MAG: indole-3-glycerol phosphate synthase TrpC [Leptospirales bacterium]
MSVLEKIIRDRKPDIPTAKEAQAFRCEPTTKDVKATLQKSENKLRLIAELKRKSPSQGEINPKIDVEAAVKLYRPFAAAMSILTEPNYFGGSLEDLSRAAELTDIPLLRKDFITDTKQVKEARHYGADFYLLIVAALAPSQLSELLDAGKEWNMPALVEIHNEKEAEIALAAGVEILGVNNRNLHDLSIDLLTTNRIYENLEKELQSIILISESGFKSRTDFTGLPERIDGVLIGTTFMKSPEPAQLLKEMFG